MGLDLGTYVDTWNHYLLTVQQVVRGFTGKRITENNLNAMQDTLKALHTKHTEEAQFALPYIQIFKDRDLEQHYPGSCYYLGIVQ